MNESTSTPPVQSSSASDTYSLFFFLRLRGCDLPTSSSTYDIVSCVHDL